MRFWIIFVVLVGLAVADNSPSMYDNVDIDAILKNGRILKNYIKCLLDKGACTPDGRKLKKVLPDALRNGCSQCDEKQKMMAEKVINFLRENRKNDWKDLTAKYDRNGEYERRFAAQLSETA